MKKLFLTISANTIENSVCLITRRLVSALFERLRFNEAGNNKRLGMQRARLQISAPATINNCKKKVGVKLD